MASLIKATPDLARNTSGSGPSHLSMWLSLSQSRNRRLPIFQPLCLPHTPIPAPTRTWSQPSWDLYFWLLTCLVPALGAPTPHCIFLNGYPLQHGKGGGGDGEDTQAHLCVNPLLAYYALGTKPFLSNLVVEVAELLKR